MGYNNGKEMKMENKRVVGCEIRNLKRFTNFIEQSDVYRKHAASELFSWGEGRALRAPTPTHQGGLVPGKFLEFGLSTP